MNPKLIKTPTVYIVDDDVELCEAMRWLLESIKVPVKTYSRGLDFLDAYQSHWQGCLLIDLRMPDISGLQLQQKLLQLENQMPIIMISGHGDIDTAVRALKAGAIDFITKPFNDDILLEKVQNVLLLENKESNKQKVLNNYKKLSDREQQVAKLIVKGQMNKQIANELNISIKTVETHRANLMQKMEVKSFAELVKIYYQYIG